MRFSRMIRPVRLSAAPAAGSPGRPRLGRVALLLLGLLPLRALPGEAHLEIGPGLKVRITPEPGAMPPVPFEGKGLRFTPAPPGAEAGPQAFILETLTEGDEPLDRCRLVFHEASPLTGGMGRLVAVAEQGRIAIVRANGEKDGMSLWVLERIADFPAGNDTPAGLELANARTALARLRHLREQKDPPADQSWAEPARALLDHIEWIQGREEVEPAVRRELANIAKSLCITAVELAQGPTADVQRAGLTEAEGGLAAKMLALGRQCHQHFFELFSRGRFLARDDDWAQRAITWLAETAGAAATYHADFVDPDTLGQIEQVRQQLQDDLQVIELPVVSVKDWVLQQNAAAAEVKAWREACGQDRINPQVTARVLQGARAARWALSRVDPGDTGWERYASEAPAAVRRLDQAIEELEAAAWAETAVDAPEQKAEPALSLTRRPRATWESIEQRVRNARGARWLRANLRRYTDELLTTPPEKEGRRQKLLRILGVMNDRLAQVLAGLDPAPALAESERAQNALAQMGEVEPQ